MKTIAKTILCVTLLLCFTTPAKAFVFTDVTAFAQRAVQFLQTAQHYIASVSHYKQVVDYAQQFNQFRNQFDTYWRTYNRIHQRVTSGQYTNAFDVTKWDWRRLDDHIIRTWRSYNRMFWDAQQLALMTNQLIQSNPAYRAYADGLIGIQERRMARLEENEAMLIELRKQNKESQETLDKLREQNRVLTTSSGSTTDPLDAAQLQSLNNLILLEHAAMKAREDAIRDAERRQEEEAKEIADEINALEIQLRQNAFEEGWGFFFNFMEQDGQ